jgi:TolB-like protein
MKVKRRLENNFKKIKRRTGMEWVRQGRVRESEDKVILELGQDLKQ